MKKVGNQQLGGESIFSVDSNSTGRSEIIFDETNIPNENISNCEEEAAEGDSNIWKAPVEETEEPSRDEEFEKYLEHLLL